MSREIELWRSVSADALLMQRASEVRAADVSAVASLRRDYAAEQVAVALSLAEARVKAGRKFSERGKTIIADAAGIEQASGAAVASYKAKRSASRRHRPWRIADLCCGIGGDAMALADQGLDVIAVDRDPLRAWMASHNGGGTRAGCVCRCGCLPPFRTGDPH